ncbi:GNAT family N-acetyltransferase [Actinoplanes sp. NPDC000266]
MTIVRAAAGLDEVAELWKALARHHYEAGAAISERAGPIGVEASWQGRRRQYEAWSAEAGWLLIVAGREGAVEGYAAARVTPSVSAWDLGERVGRLETLAVAERARGLGLGTALVGEVRAHWRRRGVRFGTVSVISGNDSARRFYERLGAVEFTRTSLFAV